MLSMITFVEWLRLAGGLILFLGPGLALVSIYPAHSGIDKTQKIALGAGLSISCWAALLAWLQLINLRLSNLSITLIFLGSWVFYLLRTRSTLALRFTPPRAENIPAYATWIVLAISTAVNVLVLRNQLVGPGSDSLHHAVIVDLFRDAGGIPSNYQPRVPLATFRYHFAFHAAAYALMSFTGLASQIITPLFAQLLVPAGGLTAAYFMTRVWKRPWGGFYAASIYSLASIFPAYLINWGRYTQSAGLMLLPLLLVEFKELNRSQKTGLRILFTGILATGLALTHYRIALMALTAGILFLINGLLPVGGLRTVRSTQISLRYALSGLASLALLAPWFWQLLKNRNIGYPPQFEVLESSFFSLDRLGQPVFDYPTNTVLLLLLIFAVLLAFWHRDRTALLILVWGAILVLLSYARLASHYLDLVTVVISLAVPASIMIGWFLIKLTEMSSSRSQALLWVPVVVVSCLGIWGALEIPTIIDPWNDNVFADDIQAMKWIDERLPKEALFAVNTLEFPFMRGFVVGVDAGYWIPVLAHRAAATYPLIYSFENLMAPDYVEHIHEFTLAQPSLASEAGLQALADLDVTHVYLGKKGGPITVKNLLESPMFKLVYDQGGVYVFEVAPSNAAVVSIN